MQGESEAKIEHQIITKIDANRFFNFTDGVFAFAATLLVVKIDLPEGLRQSFSVNFLSAFSLLWPQYLINIVTFLIIGFYWINHHAIFGKVTKLNSQLTWLNILFLVFLSFLPFPVDLFGDYSQDPMVVVFYASSIAVVGFIQALIWWYASGKHRLINSSINKKEIEYLQARSLIAPLIFTFSIPLIYIHPAAAQIMWVFVIGGILLINSLYHVKSGTTVDLD